ncbi:MAG: SIS domain-containing protein [Verrucomicrobia bacterium]|jgi:D-sedoheptulose 7-phosphate isomerase|nr:SIS domain-containing protein [Verrucomicrobiota bacterium]
MKRTSIQDGDTWLHAYFDKTRLALFDDAVIPQMIELRDRAIATADAGGKIIFAGNGASASIASHCAVDFTKQAKVQAISFNEANLITCFANDYGFENWIARAIEAYAGKDDLVVLISSSGKSPNMLCAAAHSKSQGLPVVTFSGFAEDNPLRASGDLNLWVDSRSYNIVECTHMFWLMMVCDLIVGSAEYEVTQESRTPS